MFPSWKGRLHASHSCEQASYWQIWQCVDDTTFTDNPERVFNLCHLLLWWKPRWEVKTQSYLFSLALKWFRVYIKLTEVASLFCHNRPSRQGAHFLLWSHLPFLTGFTCFLLTFLSCIFKSMWLPSFFCHVPVFLHLICVFLLFGCWTVVSSWLIVFTIVWLVLTLNSFNSLCISSASSVYIWARPIFLRVSGTN